MYPLAPPSLATAQASGPAPAAGFGRPEHRRVAGLSPRASATTRTRTACCRLVGTGLRVTWVGKDRSRDRVRGHDRGIEATALRMLFEKGWLASPTAWGLV